MKWKSEPNMDGVLDTIVARRLQQVPGGGLLGSGATSRWADGKEVAVRLKYCSHHLCYHGSIFQWCCQNSKSYKKRVTASGGGVPVGHHEEAHLTLEHHGAQGACQEDGQGGWAAPLPILEVSRFGKDAGGHGITAVTLAEVIKLANPLCSAWNFQLWSANTQTSRVTALAHGWPPKGTPAWTWSQPPLRLWSRACRKENQAMHPSSRDSQLSVWTWGNSASSPVVSSLVYLILHAPPPPSEMS